MYSGIIIPDSVMNRCETCDKAYTTSGISATTVSTLSGGVCAGCGKPAFADYVSGELDNLQNTNANSNIDDISTCVSIFPPVMSPQDAIIYD
jgi:hypothetical protein